MMRTAYSIFGRLITPALRLWLARRARRGKEDAARLDERFGHTSLPRPAGTLIWLHAASVGETQSVLTLVRALLARHPDIHLLITTGTVTSAALVAQQQKLDAGRTAASVPPPIGGRLGGGHKGTNALPNNGPLPTSPLRGEEYSVAAQDDAAPRILHQFVPVDTPAAVRRFLDHWRPDLALWVESEFWPQLLWQTHARRIPLLLVNARISARSFAGWKRWPRLIRSLLACFTGLYAGSPEDAQRLADLGADAARIHDAGNLKYDAAPLPPDPALLAGLKAACGPRRVWAAASTHANEEMMVAEAHQTLRKRFPDLLTILIPRHATRGDAIAADLRARGFTVARRSKGEPVTAATGIYLADTMGELGSFYRMAEVVFLGGSLIAHGGHNPLEPARLGCPLVTGPHTHNFAAIMQHLADAGAIRIAQDKEALAATVAALLTDEAARRSLAERAATATAQASGAGEVILQQIAALLAHSPANPAASISPTPQRARA